MAVNIEFAKKHWQAIAGGIVGLFVLYYIYSHLAGASSSPASASTSPSSPDLSGGSGQVLALASSASMQNAQTNAQVEVANLSANVAEAQTAAQLAATLAQSRNATAVALGGQATSVALGKQKEDTAITLGAQNEAVSLAQVKGAETIQQTIANAKTNQIAIEGATVTTLAATQAQTLVKLQQAKDQVALSQIGLETHVYDTLAKQHKLGGSSTGVSQIASTVLTGGESGPGVIAANQPSAVASSPGAILSGVAGVASALFG